ncbi:hypothetical protein H8D36_03290 [archaeon]|nr:hypothetical protein [archaeon]
MTVAEIDKWLLENADADVEEIEVMVRRKNNLLMKGMSKGPREVYASIHKIAPLRNSFSLNK